MPLRILFVLVLVFTSCADIYEVPVGKDETWSFVVFNDLQQGYGVFSQLAMNISNFEPAPRTAFCCGDIMLRSANEAEWLSFNHCTESIRQKMSLFIARGNHERNDSASEVLLHQPLYLQGKHMGEDLHNANELHHTFDDNNLL